MVSAIDRVARWRQRDDVLSRNVADGVLVLGESTTEPVVLAGTALVVWSALAEPVAFDDLVRSLEARFSPAPALESDVAALLGELDSAGLISTVGESSVDE